MTMAARSIWVMYKSFFNAVPGQKGLLGIGCLLIALSFLQQDANHAQLSVMAGTAFVTGFTLLFAGPHFRQLISFRRHRLLPGFKKYLIISYLLVLVSLSLFVVIGLTLLERHNSILPAQLENLATGFLWLSILSAILITSLFGFVSRYLRYLVALLIVIGVVNIPQSIELPIKAILASMIGLSVISLCCFIYFTGISSNSIFYSKKAVSLSKYSPGLSGNFQERGVTAVGSILLGISDGHFSRFMRASFTTFLLPLALACAALLNDKHSVEQVFKNPLFILMGLMTATMLQIHFAFRVAARRRFIWLRVGGGHQHINQLAQTVLAKERWAMIIYFGLWSIPVIALHPTTSVWLLGVGSLLWFMMLVLERLILTVRVQLSPRAEFYWLLVFVGLVVSFIAVANVQGTPRLIWWGAVTLLCLYLALGLRGKAQEHFTK